MSRKYPLLYDKAWLTQKYVEEELSLDKIAKILGCSRTTLTNVLRGFDITIRTKYDVLISHKELRDKSWLEKRYLEERLSTCKIAKLLGGTTPSVLAALKRHKIPTRSQSESMVRYEQLYERSWLENAYLEKKLTVKEIGKILGCAPTTVSFALDKVGIQARTPSESKEKYKKMLSKTWLTEKYIDEMLSSMKIAEIVGCKPGTIRKALNKYNIPIRSASESQKGRHHTDETRKRIGDGNRGKNVSLETRRKISVANTGKPSPMRGCCGKDSPSFGRTHTVESRLKMSESLKGEKCYWYGKGLPDEMKEKISESLKGSRNPMYGKHLSKERKSILREARKHQKFPTHHTKIERILIAIFEKHKLPIEYTGDSAFWIDSSEVSMNPDFIVHNKKIVIEANGEYMHYSLTNYKRRYTSGVVYRRKQLKERGWKLIVFWESDILRKDAEQYILHVLRKEGIV